MRVCVLRVPTSSSASTQSRDSQQGLQNPLHTNLIKNLLQIHEHRSTHQASPNRSRNYTWTDLLLQYQRPKSQSERTSPEYLSKHQGRTACPIAVCLSIRQWLKRQAYAEAKPRGKHPKAFVQATSRGVHTTILCAHFGGPSASIEDSCLVQLVVVRIRRL